MTVGDSPAVARHHVRLAIRAARQEMKLTQGQVAKALDWSLSKVQRIESGEVSVSTTDLRYLLTYLGITDEGTIRRLMDGARVSRRERWFTDPKYREHLTTGTRRMLQFESEATIIRAFNPTVVPGLLQTAAYAREMFHSKSDLLSEVAQDLRYEVRMRRREQVFSHDKPPEYMLVLDESVFWREVGGARVAADQFADLLTMMREPGLSVRVLPFNEVAVVAMLGPFTIFELTDDADSVLYTERYDEDEVIQKPREVQKHRLIFEDLWSRSLDESASERLILARTADLLSSLDRRGAPG